MEIKADGDSLTIKIPKEHLFLAFRICPLIECPNPKADGYVSFDITDKAEFIMELLTELQKEEEDGSTELHHLFDKAFLSMCENGALGISEELVSNDDVYDRSEPKTEAPEFMSRKDKEQLNEVENHTINGLSLIDIVPADGKKHDVRISIVNGITKICVDDVVVSEVG